MFGLASLISESILNFLFHDSIRTSSDDINSEKFIGLNLVHKPPGLLKSGMPDSVEIPAPVKITMFELSLIISLKASISFSSIIIIIIKKVNKKPNND